MADLFSLTAEELAAGIRLRRWPASEVLEAHLARIRAKNPALNALVLVDEEGARRRAAEADSALASGICWGRLHGVPITIKDVLATAGLRTTAGFPPLAEYVPTQDATVVARLRAAGAVILGKTNTPLLAMNYQCDSPLLGRANHPLNSERSPGGSTGGGAAAVAAGLSPLEIGSDIGGSVRIPAHYCGIYSIKPTEHLVPVTGHIPELPGAPRGVRHMATIGPLARSVPDLRLALQIIAGPDGGFWETPPVALEPVELRQPRIGWADTLGDCPVTAGTKAALAALADKLERAGWLVEAARPDMSFERAWETYGQVLWCEVASSMPPEAEAAWVSDIARNCDDPISRGIASCAGASMRQFTAAMTARDALIAALDRFFDRYDALLCPVTVGPAIRHCPQGSPVPVDGTNVPYWMGGLAYTSPFNVTGNPAVVLPLAASAEGLPIGVQVVGRRWNDMRVLAVAELIDRFQPVT
ncbi:MAG: amidase [Bryobacteraceae bacterium]